MSEQMEIGVSELVAEADLPPVVEEEEMVMEQPVEQEETIMEQEEVEVPLEMELPQEEAEEEPKPEVVKQPEETVVETKPKITMVPPLRPLNIAPKPPPNKMPITLKPVTGQQLLLLQGASSGQAIKIVSPQGQELNLGNFSLSRQMTLRPAIKTINTQGQNISIVSPKPVVMKKILTTGQKTVQKPLTAFTNKAGQHFMVVQKAETSNTTATPLKIVQGSTLSTIPNPTKTITIQQAQEMGLLTNAKIVPQPQASSTPKLISKAQQKTIKFLPQVSPLVQGGLPKISLGTLKSPAKILPAAKPQQRMILKTTQTILPSGQIIQVAGTQALNTGQLHQINIPGKGMQYIKFVTTSGAEAGSTSTLNTVKASSAGGNIVLSEIKPMVSTSTLVTKPLQTIGKQVNVGGTQMVVIPSSFTTLSSQVGQTPKLTLPVRHTTVAPKIQSPVVLTEPAVSEPPREANGMRPRKPCNCTKSQCLKLYCDCFANGEFCYMCNCMNCYNNLENEDHRNRAIKSCLDRNPNAFRPKIGKAKDTSGETPIRKHTKGCNCKRSGCLKNYCECYEAKIACSNNCKCVGCRNIEDSLDKKGRFAIDNGTPGQTALDKARPKRATSARQAISFITEDVIEATCQCLLTLSDGAQDALEEEEVTKSHILEEFGRCLQEIIGCTTSSRSID